MFLVDTCGWIEWMTDAPLSKKYSRYLKAPESLLVPTLVQHELYKWLCREIDKPVASLRLQQPKPASVIPLDTSIALFQFAAEIATEFKLVTADAIIYAMARQHRATLITSDAHFANRRR